MNRDSKRATLAASGYFPLYKETPDSRLAPVAMWHPVGQDSDENWLLADAMAVVVAGLAEAVGDADGQVVYDRAQCERLLELAQTVKSIRCRFPGELLGRRQWVLWHRVPDKERPGKFRKPPHSPRTGQLLEGKKTSAERQSHYMTFDDVEVAALKHGLDGVGIELTADDPYVIVDFDGAVQDGVPHPDVKTWLRWFPTYTEYSVSGRGIHAICLGKTARNLKAKPVAGDALPTVEVFGQEQFIACTGRSFGDYTETSDCQTGINKLFTQFGNEGVGTEGEERPMSKRTAQRIYADNLEALREAVQGEGNALLNSTAFFAGRAFASKALDGTEASIKQQLREIVTKEWSSPHPQPGADQTIDSGWTSGVAKPLQVREETEAELIVAALNEKFFVVQNYGGKCRVGWFEEDDHPDLKGRVKLGHQSFAEFQNANLNKLVPLVDEKGQVRYEPQGHYWLRHGNRREYWRVVFLPGLKAKPNLLNLWGKGFSYKAKKGDCSLYLAHLRDIICNGNEEHYQYTIKWMARGVQRPWERGHVALVWRGDKGPGKNVAADAFAKLFGSHAMTITQAEHLVGRFNAHLRAKCVLIANEAFYAGNKQHEATLKGLVTDVTLPIEQKFVDAETDVNLLHLIVLSNNDWVVPATEKERRFFMVDVSDARIGDYAYFAALQRQLETGGYEALLHHLSNEINITDFNVRDVPKTEALRSQMAMSLTGVDAVWYECLQRGELPGQFIKGTFWLRSSDLVKWAANQRRREWGSFSSEKVGHLLGHNTRSKQKGMGFSKEQTTLFNTGQKNQGWIIPNLKLARATWSQKRFEATWDDTVTEWQIVGVRD